MKVILDYWNRRWQSIVFDPVRGEGRVRWLSRKPKHCSGWATHHEGRWYAVWLDRDDLIFQSGQNRWHLDDALQCRNIRHGTNRIFTVEQNGTTVFKRPTKRRSIKTTRPQIRSISRLLISSTGLLESVATLD